MALSTDRLLELVEIYSALKVRVLQVDEKYSLDFVEPKLDMPDSLNLVKLTYEPKSEEELMELARQKVEASIISKQAQLDKNYNTKTKNLALQTQKQQLTTNQKLVALQKALDKEFENIHNRMVNNGLIFSTVTTKYQNKARQEHNEKVSQLNSDNEAALALIEQQQQDADALYKQSCDSLDTEAEARVQASYNKLLEDEESLKRAIDKYNTGLDEKETKYQASRAKAYESARRADYNRAYNNSKLYMQLGETGYRRMISMEKYIICQDVFYPLRREEGRAILSMDGFLVMHLGPYYDAFVSWVDTTLLP